MATPLTYTRVTLDEALGAVEMLADMCGSASAACERLVELEAEQHENERIIDQLRRETSELRAAMAAADAPPRSIENGEREGVKQQQQSETRGFTPEAILKFLKRHTICSADVDRLLPLLVECQQEQEQELSGGGAAKVKSAGDPPKHLLMLTVQSLAAAELAPLFNVSSRTAASAVPVLSLSQPEPATSKTLELVTPVQVHLKQPKPVEAAKEVAASPATPVKRRVGRPPKRAKESPGSTPSLPARRGRPPGRGRQASTESNPRPTKRGRKHHVEPKQILQWPRPPDSSDVGEILDYRVVASLDNSKPWDAMHRQRARSLHIPNLASRDVLRWVTSCLSAQHTRRRAYWERLHWLPEESCKGMQWEKYKVARQERAARADREWKKLYDESVRLMNEGLLPSDVWCDPALWPLPEEPVLLLPRSVDLHAQIRLVDMQDPVRLYYVDRLSRHPFFVDGIVKSYPAKRPVPRVNGCTEEEEEQHEENKGTAGETPWSAKENIGDVFLLNTAEGEESGGEEEGVTANGEQGVVKPETK